MEKTCEICRNGFAKQSGRHKYCQECQDSGAARKYTLHKYNTSFKNRIVQRKWYYKDIERTKRIKNTYNRSIKGKASKMKYYFKNRENIINEMLTTRRSETLSRTNAHDKAKRQKVPRVCVLCFSKDKIVVHHINRNPFDNNLDNLVYLCSSCHGQEHEAINSGRSNLPLLRQSPISIKKIIESPWLIAPN